MKELATARQYNVGCTWVILNNSAFGWPKFDEMETVGWNTATFEFQPDFVKWAEACKCFGRRIEKPSEIRPMIEEALEANRDGTPAVLDFVTGIDMSHLERAE
jgi:acetolactate synthase-1/2/3 large subunit